VFEPVGGKLANFFLIVGEQKAHGTFQVKRGLVGYRYR
jgi:hypothetical protein